MSGASATLSLYVPLSGRECHVSRVDTARRRLRLSIGEEGQELKIAPFLPVGAEPPLDPIAMLLHGTPVEASWHSPASDLGDASHEKLLDGVTVTGEGRIGVRVCSDKEAQESTAVGGGEECEVDLGHADFAGGAHTVRLCPRIRAFERIRLELSTTDPHARIYGVSIEAHAKHYRNGEVQ